MSTDTEGGGGGVVRTEENKMADRASFNTTI